MNNLDYKLISVGDLIIQELCSPPDIRVTKRGIIIDVTNNISTIEWTTDTFDKVYTIPRITSIQNISLRKMIMAGTVKHYPVVK